MGTTIFKIFIWGGIPWIYVRKSRFTAPRTRRRKTKFPTVYPTIYPPPNKNFEYSYPLIDSQISHTFVRRGSHLN